MVIQNLYEVIQSNTSVASKTVNRFLFRHTLTTHKRHPNNDRYYNNS